MKIESLVRLSFLNFYFLDTINNLIEELYISNVYCNQ